MWQGPGSCKDAFGVRTAFFCTAPEVYDCSRSGLTLMVRLLEAHVYALMAPGYGVATLF